MNTEPSVPKKGEWKCEKCNNMNYAYRKVCNMRKCREPRPRDEGEDELEPERVDPKKEDPEKEDPEKEDPEKENVDLEKEKKKDSKNSKQMKNGEWNCKECGNLNFATRIRCNMRKCQAPREEWICPVCKNINYKFRTVCNMRSCQAPRPPETYPVPPISQRMYGPPPPGFGLFPLGLNQATRYPLDINSIRQQQQNFLQLQMLLSQLTLPPVIMPPIGYPRNHFRGHGYQKNLYKNEAYGQARMPNASSRRMRPGDWRCLECNNINYSNRQKCNMRKCGAERPTGER